MIFDSVIPFILLSLVACLVSYFAGRTIYKNKITQSLARFTSLTERLKNLERENKETNENSLVLKEQLNSSECQLGKLETELRMDGERRTELEKELDGLSYQLQKTIDLQRSAEGSEQTARAQLGERTEQLKEHSESISELKQTLSSKRDELTAAHLKTAEADKQSKANEVKASEFSKNSEDYKITLVKHDERYEALNLEHKNLSTEHAEMKIIIKEREDNLSKQVEQFEEQKVSLSAHFKSLANDVLDVKSKSLQQTSQQSISSLMSPFKNSMDEFKKEVQDIHHRDGLQQGELKKELQGLRELNHQLSTEAHELSTALRGQSKLQGNWGELVLENVLDRSGLQIGKDYKREVSINTEEGRLRPDVVIYLPQNKHLVIDSKVSLNAYTRFVNAEDDTERALALKGHVKAVGDRINELADKEYGKLPGLNSPEMVFMFVPIESAFVEALKADESLFQRAIEKNVLVATPTTLLTSLNIVRQLWRFEDQNKHTALLADKAEQVFKKLKTFLVSFSNVKKGLDNANDAYSKAENQLLSGRANLVKQVNEFKKLAPSITDELPEYFREKADLEIELNCTGDEASVEIETASNDALLTCKQERQDNNEPSVIGEA